MASATDRQADELRRIGEVAQATGLTPRAIRYYQELRLLKPAAHVSGANRRYDDDDVQRLRLIKTLQETAGLSLADVQTLLETEDAARALRAQYHASMNPADQLAVLECAEPVLRRRVALLEQKLAAVASLLAEERARLVRNRGLQREHRARADRSAALA